MAEITDLVAVGWVVEPKLTATQRKHAHQRAMQRLRNRHPIEFEALYNEERRQQAGNHERTTNDA